MEHNFTFDHVFAPDDGQEAVKLDQSLWLRVKGSCIEDQEVYE